MALTLHDVRELLAARDAGASFDRVLTVGRQGLVLHRADLERLPAAARATSCDTAEELLRTVLGSRDVVALDASAYEGAELLHDLNDPVPSAWEEEYDAVIDAGSLEHVFDVRTALANLMRMTRTGGRVFLSAPANNLLGHGFYQFSPELFFRVFAPERGFRVERVVVAEARYPGIELTPARRAYAVTDPADAGERVGLRSRRPATVLVHAVKTRHLPDPLAAAPQQSDYVGRWTEGRAHGGAGRPLAQRLPDPVRRHVRGLRQQQRFRLGNRRFFRPLG